MRLTELEISNSRSFSCKMPKSRVVLRWGAEIRRNTRQQNVVAMFTSNCLAFPIPEVTQFPFPPVIRSTTSFLPRYPRLKKCLSRGCSDGLCLFSASSRMDSIIILIFVRNYSLQILHNFP